MTIEYILNGVFLCLILLAITAVCVWWMFKGPE